MPIPAWAPLGLLPPGVHLATLADIEAHLCWNPHRAALWEGGLQFLRYLSSQGMVYGIGIGGGFTTTKPLPADVDIILDLTQASDAHQQKGCQWFNERRTEFKTTYSIDFLINLPSNSDFFSFLQYVGPKSAMQTGLKEKDLKGVLRVQSWADGLKT